MDSLLMELLLAWLLEWSSFPGGHALSGQEKQPVLAHSGAMEFVAVFINKMCYKSIKTGFSLQGISLLDTCCRE